MSAKRVAVLYGGLSAEREVSLSSGSAVAEGLAAAGYDVVRIDVGREIDRQLRDAAPDAAFIALHGRFGEDGTIQGLLELLGIPYTGSSVLASALAMDKILTRQVLTASGISVAPGGEIAHDEDAALPDGISLPVVVKPSCEGSSVGVSIARTSEQLRVAIRTASAGGSRLLVEQFISGVEINVAVLDGQVLGSVEIVPNAGEFYDYQSKYAAGGSTHHIPPRIPEAERRAVESIGLAAYLAIGCSGAARVDLIAPPNGSPIVLEVNTIPGMTRTSLLPEIAAVAGFSFHELVSRIVERARLHVVAGALQS